MSYNLSHQHLQLIHEHILGLLGLLRLVIKIPYQRIDSLTRLEHEAQMINQSLKGLFALGGQAQILFNLKPSVLRGVVFHFLYSFPMGQVTFKKMYPDVLEP